MTLNTQPISDVMKYKIKKQKKKTEHNIKKKPWLRHEFLFFLQHLVISVHSYILNWSRLKYTDQWSSTNNLTPLIFRRQKQKLLTHKSGPLIGLLSKTSQWNMFEVGLQLLLLWPHHLSSNIMGINSRWSQKTPPLTKSETHNLPWRLSDLYLGISSFIFHMQPLVAQFPSPATISSSFVVDQYYLLWFFVHIPPIILVPRSNECECCYIMFCSAQVASAVPPVSC